MTNRFVKCTLTCIAALVLTFPISAGTEDAALADELPAYVSLDVDELLQLPELPTGCESVALTIALRYYGFDDLEKTTIADDYLVYSDNFVTGYVGDPFSEDGAGCYAPGIAETANRYLREKAPYLEAKDITGSTRDELYRYLANGNPVVVWSGMYFADSIPSGMCEVYDGVEYEWRYNEHCIVLSGYDLERGIVEVSDPLEGKVARDAERFWELYEQMGSMAIVIE